MLTFPENTPKEIQDRIANIQSANASMRRPWPSKSVRLPPPGPDTRYWMARATQGSVRTLGAGEEVTALVGEWHKSGSLRHLLQRHWVLAHPPVDVFAVGQPPALPPAKMTPPSAQEIEAKRGCPSDVAQRIAALEHDAWLRRLKPYGDNPRTEWMRFHGKEVEQIEAQLNAKDRPQHPSDPTLHLVEKATTADSAVASYPPPAQPAQKTPPAVDVAPESNSSGLPNSSGLSAQIKARLSNLTEESTNREISAALLAAGAKLPAQVSKGTLLEIRNSLLR